MNMQHSSLTHFRSHRPRMFFRRFKFALLKHDGVCNVQRSHLHIDSPVCARGLTSLFFAPCLARLLLSLVHFGGTISTPASSRRCLAEPFVQPRLPDAVEVLIRSR